MKIHEWLNQLLKLVVIGSLLVVTGCMTTIETTHSNGDVTKAKYKKGAYRAMVEAELLREITDKTNSNKIALAQINVNRIKCQAPNMQGASETAQLILAMAYDRCAGAPDSNAMAMVVSAATGNPLDPDAQAFVSHNRTVREVYAQDQATKRAWITGVLGIVPTVAYVWRDYELAKRNTGQGGQSITMGDGSSIQLTGSNSGAHSGEGGAGGGEGAGGDGTTGTQTRQMSQSIFGNSSNAYGYAVSGTIDALNGEVTQTDVAVTDEGHQRAGQNK